MNNWFVAMVVLFGFVDFQFGINFRFWLIVHAGYVILPLFGFYCYL